MCVAAIINRPLSLEYLREMDNDNPHGAGVAFILPGDTQITFMKGLAATDIFVMQEDKFITYPYLLHFRWATHGKVVPELTHPFPLGARALLGELSGRAPSVLIHNGVWNDCTAWEDLVKAPAALVDSTSDTGILAYLLGEYPTLYDLLDEVPWAVAVATMGAGAMKIDKRGRTWQEFEGNVYSNLQWLPARMWWEHNGYRYERNETVHMPARIIERMSDQEWEDYLVSRYGKEVASEALSAEPEPETPDARLYCDVDIISENPATVNEWLAKRSA